MSTTSSTWTDRRERPPIDAVPVRLGRYELARMLGRGGSATVFAGYDPKLDRPVAVKVFGEHAAGFVHGDGVRPWDSNRPALVRRRPPKRGKRRTPASLDRVLLRGLAVEPRLRLEIMGALVDALIDVSTETDRRRACWRSVALVLAGFVLAGALDRCM